MLFRSLVIATDGTGANNDIVFATGGFLTANEKMRFIDAQNQFYIKTTTVSTSTSTGALRVAGGVGIAGNTFIGGTLSASGTLTSGNLATTGTLSAGGNANVGNLGTSGLVTATGNITGANILTGGLISAAGNLTSANVNTGNISASGDISATGNVTANTKLFVGSGGSASGYSNPAFLDRKSTRLNSSHSQQSRMPSSA